MRIAFLVMPENKQAETGGIKALCLPLDLKGNTSHPFYPTIKALRRGFRRHAPSLDSDDQAHRSNDPTLEAISAIYRSLRKDGR